MKNLRLYFSVILSMTITAHAQQKQNSSSGFHFAMAPVYGVNNVDEAKKTFGESSAKFYAWDEQRKRQYRDSGAAYYNKYPSEKGFEQWFEQTLGEDCPRYWKDPQLSGENLAAALSKGVARVPDYDTIPENHWRNQYLIFRNEYLKRISTEKGKEFLLNEFQNKISSVSDHIYKSHGDLSGKFRQSVPLIQELAMEATSFATGDYHNARPLQSLIEQFGQYDSALEQSLEKIIQQTGDSTSRAWVDEYEKHKEKLKLSPAGFTMRSIFDGTLMDLKKMQGKVVLVDFWNRRCAGCIASMPKYQRLYNQFHQYGFEIYSVCVFGLDKMEESKEKQLVLKLLKERGATYPTGVWASGMDDRYNFRNDPDWDRFGYASGGTTFLLDQQGKLVVTSPDGQWLEFYIRKLLGLPLDQTGKQ